MSDNVFMAGEEEEDTLMVNTKVNGDAGSELLAALASENVVPPPPPAHPLDSAQLLDTASEGADPLQALGVGTTQEKKKDSERRKRRRNDWEKQQEERRRWELQCKLVDISTNMEVLAREVARARAEHKVALPDLDSLPADEKLIVEASQRRRMRDLLQNHCKKTLTTMMQHKWSWPFNTGVDTNVYKDYLETVSTPMDFGSIKQRIDKGYYSHPNGFLSDVRLVFDNARAYNKPGSDVHVMATTLQEKFEEKYASAVAPRVAEADAVTRAEQLAARKRHAGSAGTAQEAAHEAKLNALIRKAEDIYSRIADAKGAAAALCTPVTRAEKEALCAALGRLPQQQFEGAVGLVMHHHPGLQPFDDVAFDLEMLDGLTLRQMQSFIATCQAAGNGDTTTSNGGDVQEDGSDVQVAVRWPGLALGAGLAAWKPPKRPRRASVGGGGGKRLQAKDNTAEDDDVVVIEEQKQQRQEEPSPVVAPVAEEVTAVDVVKQPAAAQPDVVEQVAA